MVFSHSSTDSQTASGNEVDGKQNFSFKKQKKKNLPSKMGTLAVERKEHRAVEGAGSGNEGP